MRPKKVPLNCDLVFLALVTVFSAVLSSADRPAPIRTIDWEAVPCPPEKLIIRDIDLNGDGRHEELSIQKELANTSGPSWYPREFWDDCYRLTIRDSLNGVAYTEDFCSAYGDFKIYALNLTGGKQVDIIFELYKNRGVGVTEKYLVVKHWDGTKLVEKASVPASVHASKTKFGPMAYCEKRMRFRSTHSGFWQATLELRCERTEGGRIEDPTEVQPDTPAEKEFLSAKIQKLAYDAQSDSYHLLAVKP